MRKPGRTATTAAALMIGLALIVFVTVFAAGINELGRQDDRRQLPRRDRDPELDGFSPFPRDALDKARKVAGVRA